MTTSPHRLAQCSPQYAAERTQLLFSCYRKSDASDAKTFVTAIAATLARYPEEIVTRVTHPVDGLPASCKFPPGIAEVKAACEELMAPVYAARRRELEAQRTRNLLAPPSTPPEVRERAVRKWFDEIRPAILPPARATLTREDAKAKLMHLGGLTPEQFDAIADAPDRSTFQRLKGNPQ